MPEEVAGDIAEVRVFAGDSTGRLKVLHTKSKKYEQVYIPNWQYGPAVACQDLVYGNLTAVDGTSWPLVCISLLSRLLTGLPACNGTQKW